MRYYNDIVELNYVVSNWIYNCLKALFIFNINMFMCLVMLCIYIDIIYVLLVYD